MNVDISVRCKNTYANISAISTELRSTSSKRIGNKIHLYSSGVKAKLRQAEYAFERIKELAPSTDVVTNSTSLEDFSLGERTEFFVDSFFAFLYSSFDIVSHVVNSKYGLGMKERSVSFNEVRKKLGEVRSGSEIQKLYLKISKKQYFRALDKYRNCSTHRRQIYIKTINTTESDTPGYEVTQSFAGTKHILCDDPLTLVPKIAKNRELVGYCLGVLSKGMQEIEGIYKKL